MQVTHPPSASLTEDLQPTNRIAQLRDKPPKLTTEQVESYLKANRRNAASLLAAYRTTGNPALLKEAMQQYPNDPQVDFEAVFTKDASPEQRRQWLDAFKQSAPENALANYLSALDYFKAGQTDQAVQELIAASDKPQLQNYSLDRVQDDEEAYLAAGYSEAEAAAVAHAGLPCPDLQPLRVVVRDYLVPLANSYQQVDDEQSAQAALQMGLNLCERLKGSAGPLIDNLMGFAIQRSVLASMDPNSPYGSTGQTVQNQFDAIVQQQVTLGRFAGVSEDNLLPTLSDQELVNFFNRVKLFGEADAARWLVNKYGQK
jgi:ABC-type transporter MlaC component